MTNADLIIDFAQRRGFALSIDFVTERVIIGRRRFNSLNEAAVWVMEQDVLLGEFALLGS